MAELTNHLFVPVKEASRILGISVSTLYRYEGQGLISSIRTAGGHRRYSMKALEEFKNKMGSNEFIPKRGRPIKKSNGQLRLFNGS